MQGVNQGAEIAQAQNRTELAIQEMTLRREAQQRANEAQQLSAQRTLQDMQLRQQQAAREAQKAAIQWQGQQEYSQLVAGGMDPQEAYMRTAAKMHPAGLGPMISRQAARQQQQAELARRSAADRAIQSRFDISEQRRMKEIQDREAKETSAKLKSEEITPLQKQVDRLEEQRLAVQFKSVYDKPELKTQDLIDLDRQLLDARMRLNRVKKGGKASDIPPPTSINDVEFKSEEEEASWYNAKRALDKGHDRETVLKRMRDAGFTTEGL